MNNEFFNKFQYTSKNSFNYLINVSQKYKIAYFEIPKTGCSTIKKTLQFIEKDGETIEKNQVHDKKNSPLKGIFDLPESETNTILLTNEYFKFAFVRNPYDRVLSAYLDKIVTNMWEKERRVQQLGYKFEDEISFLDFLKAIEHQDPLIMDIHWKPQVYLLPTNFSDFNYIAKFENFQSDWEEILTLLQNRLLDKSKEDLFRSQDVFFHKTDAQNKIKQFYGDEEKALVQKIYKLDFETFQYKY